jgi:hypothetical protein
LKVVDSLVKAPIPCNSLVRLKNLNVSFLSLVFSMAPINSTLIPLCSNIFGAPKLKVTFPFTSSLSYNVASLVISPLGSINLNCFLFSSVSTVIVHFGLLNRPDNYISKLKINKISLFFGKREYFLLIFKFIALDI